MPKVSWKPGNMIYPLPVVMVSCQDKEGKANIITVAWTGTVNTNPPMAYISIRPTRYSYELIKQSKEFVINLTTKDLAKATDYCGVRSGRDVDKFKEMRLTKGSSAKVSAPLIVESPVNIECKVKKIVPMGSHDMIVADVVNVMVSDEYLDQNGSFDLASTNPIVYSHGSYFDLGRKLGQFGFSVRKSKKHRAQKNKK